jgi:acyl carrier protein
MWTEAAEDVKRYIVDHILDGRDGDELTFESPLLEWGVIDSLTIVDLVDFVKTKFSIDLPASELNPRNLESIRSFTGLMERFRKNPA